MYGLNHAGSSSIVTTIVLVVLATFFVSIRFYTRGIRHSGGGIGIDDWLILPGLLFFYLYAADGIYGMSY